MRFISTEKMVAIALEVMEAERKRRERPWLVEMFMWVMMIVIFYGVSAR